MVHASRIASTNPLQIRHWYEREWLWTSVLTLVVLIVYVSTAQWHINGSQSPYATDVGEIQNALPRWGTLHFTGYPLYSVLGSLFVTIVRLLGIEPAAASSLYSAVWGAASIALLYLLARELGAMRAPALAASLVASLATSMWIDASIAEIHTMTMALTLMSLLYAIRFVRSGRRRDLLLLVLAFTQGVAHQRAVAFAAPGLAYLIYPRWRQIWREAPRVLAISLLAPLTYLYLPIRAWQGADWTFNQPGTWRGFWTMISDTKSERILSFPGSAREWWERALLVLELLRDDLPLALTGAGLVGLVVWSIRERSRAGWSMLLVAAPYLLLCIVIWEGQVSDALLAVKLPVSLLFVLGLALWPLKGSSSIGQWALAALLLVASVYVYDLNRATVLTITRDRSTEKVIAAVEAIPRTAQPTTVMALWGHDYWALAYAQDIRGELDGLILVDHNAKFGNILAEGQRLVTLEKTFYRWPVSHWQEELGAVHLSSAARGIVEISTFEREESTPGGEDPFDLGIGIAIDQAFLTMYGSQDCWLSIDWYTLAPTDYDYSVAVHLLAKNPPSGPEDILAQADRNNPVYGWYPTSLWREGEVVHDDYVISIPPDRVPVGVRVGMYRQTTEGQFLNSEWLFLPLDPPHHLAQGG